MPAGSGGVNISSGCRDAESQTQQPVCDARRERREIARGRADPLHPGRTRSRPQKADRVVLPQRVDRQAAPTRIPEIGGRMEEWKNLGRAMAGYSSAQAPNSNVARWRCPHEKTRSSPGFTSSGNRTASPVSGQLAPGTTSRRSGSRRTRSVVAAQFGHSKMYPLRASEGTSSSCWHPSQRIFMKVRAPSGALSGRSQE